MARGDGAAGTHDTHELTQGRGRIRDVPKQVRERQGIERLVGKRKLVRGPFDESNAGRAAAGFGEHLRTLVDTDDGAVLLPDQLARDRARSRRDVEHDVVRCDVHARDEKPPPPRILTEREQRRVAIVCRPERCKERARGGDLVHARESMLARWR